MDKTKWLSILSYPLWIITAPLYYFRYRDDDALRFHLAQSLKIVLLVFIVFTLWLILTLLLVMIPLIGPLVSAFIMADLLGMGVFIIYLSIRGMNHAARGLQVRLPLVNWAYDKLTRKKGKEA